MSAILTCGLSPPEVRDRVAAGQVNTPPPAPGRTLGQILRANVVTRFNAILGSLFVVVVIVGPPQDALFGLILAVNTGVGVAQELRAKRALDKLAILTAARARVLRDGAIAEISQDEVVQDDVLYLRRGDQVPVARVVLLDGTFAAIPQLLDEARRVIANIERVAGLFVTKTAYAAILAVAVGAAGIAYPFYPRHLAIISTLTIGVPGFFLALAAGAPRARPGFTRLVLTFAIPAGISAATAALSVYALARAADGVSAQAARTAALLALLTVGLWVLGIVAGRAAWRITLVAAMAACLVPLFAVPVARSTFAVQLPPPGVLFQAAGMALAAIAGLTLWRRYRPVR